MQRGVFLMLITDKQAFVFWPFLLLVWLMILLICINLMSKVAMDDNRWIVLTSNDVFEVVLLLGAKDLERLDPQALGEQFAFAFGLFGHLGAPCYHFVIKFIVWTGLVVFETHERGRFVQLLVRVVVHFDLADLVFQEWTMDLSARQSGTWRVIQRLWLCSERVEGVGLAVIHSLFATAWDLSDHILENPAVVIVFWTFTGRRLIHRTWLFVDRQVVVLGHALEVNVWTGVWVTVHQLTMVYDYVLGVDILPYQNHFGLFFKDLILSLARTGQFLVLLLETMKKVGRVSLNTALNQSSLWCVVLAVDHFQELRCLGTPHKLRLGYLMSLLLQLRWYLMMICRPFVELIWILLLQATPTYYSLLSLQQQLLLEFSGLGQLILLFAVNVRLQHPQDLNIAQRRIRIVKLGK